jgi:glycosyltransferase involved in cell wall biosynthesis
MASSDASVKVAKKYTDKVFSHPDVGYADPARNFALSKAKQPCILVLDADETIPPTLQTKIEELLSQPQADIYWLARQNFVFGAWLNKAGWWPDHQPRLFRKGSVSWAVGVHRMPDMFGQQLRLPPKPEWSIRHQNYTSIEQFVEKLNVYTGLQANEQILADPQAGLTASQVSVPLKAYFANFTSAVSERGSRCWLTRCLSSFSSG